MRTLDPLRLEALKKMEGFRSSFPRLVVLLVSNLVVIKAMIPQDGITEIPGEYKKGWANLAPNIPMRRETQSSTRNLV